MADGVLNIAREATDLSRLGGGGGPPLKNKKTLKGFVQDGRIKGSEWKQTERAKRLQILDLFIYSLAASAAGGAACLDDHRLRAL